MASTPTTLDEIPGALRAAKEKSLPIFLGDPEIMQDTACVRDVDQIGEMLRGISVVASILLGFVASAHAALIPVLTSGPTPVFGGYKFFYTFSIPAREQLNNSFGNQNPPGVRLRRAA